MPRGVTLPPGPSLYPECYRSGTSGERRHWAEGTVTCARCRAQARRKVIRYRSYSARFGRRSIPALSTQRRIMALNRWGIPRAQISDRLGVTSSALSRIMEQEICFADTAAKVARVYREMVVEGKPGTSLRTRNRAIAAGWAGPMDWDDIDDPREVPYSYSVEVAQAQAIEAAHVQALEMDRQRAEHQRNEERLRRRREMRAQRTPEEQARDRAANQAHKAARRTRQLAGVAA